MKKRLCKECGEPDPGLRVLAVTGHPRHSKLLCPKHYAEGIEKLSVPLVPHKEKTHG